MPRPHVAFIVGCVALAACAGTGAPPDPQLQAGAYEGALRSALGDPHIVGTFFYAWGNPPWAPDNLPAAEVLRSVYNSPDA